MVDGGRWILVIKAGSTMPSLRSRSGDFEHWILRGMRATPSEADVVNVEAGERLPEHQAHAAIAITGSHAMVTDHWDWSDRAAAWLAEEVRLGTPVLGVCYGHQLLAYALGGDVADNPKGREFGTVPLRLEAEARTDPLMGDLPSCLPAQASHTQSVLRMPTGAVRLASSLMDANHAVRFARSAWGVQFHPEFDAEVLRDYARCSREELVTEGRDPDRVLQEIQETPLSAQVLSRFVKIARGAVR